MPNTDDERAKKAQAEDDRCWDGNWSNEGVLAMFVSLTDADFEENELLMFENEQKAAGGTLLMEQEFLNLSIAPFDDLETFWYELTEKVLQPRNLHLADGVLHRLMEGICPSRIRIQRIPVNGFSEILDWKQKGNQAFAEKKYQKAIDHYDEAMTVHTGDYFVLPAEQMEQIVNILSNSAECSLRLKDYHKVGSEATNALLLDNSHEKSRMRRVKAELAIGGISYLVQAQEDLEAIVLHDQSEAGVKQAKQYLQEVEELMESKRKAHLKKNPKTDWALYIRDLRSRCW